MIHDTHQGVSELLGAGAHGWPARRLGSFLVRVKQRAEIDEASSYQQITVRLHGKGVVPRGTVDGRQLGASRQFVASAGQLIMSRIDARNGAFGIVPPELDGALVTGDFPLYELDRGIVDADYLALVLGAGAFVELCQRCSRGTTNRKRIDERRLLGHRLAIPPAETQLRVVQAAARLRSLQRQARLAEQQTSDLLDVVAGVYTRIVDH